ncbi:hypothetical protein [Labrys sp. LIt4]|uniref:hypothetical protein n=1 Tax=Labrys sp. LIt4 TaxID=2821355 RepID=UPI001FD78123|nr:hypothetical protein [Labrys sp. LIt4]
MATILGANRPIAVLLPVSKTKRQVLFRHSTGSSRQLWKTAGASLLDSGGNRKGSMGGSNMAFAIKAEIHDLDVEDFSFPAQKTMYGGKHVAAGDIIFLFASENEGGHGLFARGIVTCAQPIAKKQSVLRQTPRVSISVRRTALAQTLLEQSAFRRERVFALSLCLDASLRLLVTASNRKTL